MKSFAIVALAGLVASASAAVTLADIPTCAVSIPSTRPRVRGY